MTSEKCADEKGGIDDSQADHVGVHDVVRPELFSFVQFNNLVNLLIALFSCVI